MNAFRESLSHLEPKHRFLLAILGAASFFDGYDTNIVAVALPQIRDTFGLSQSEASFYISILFLGALPAVFITRWADRRGRRRVLLFSILGYTVATGLTALAPSMEIFVACQFVARIFLNAEGAIVWTMVTEELPARSRGLGFGWLAMLTAVGTGSAAILYATAFAPLGISWRWLYVVSVPPLLAISYLRRKLPESTRFEAARDTGMLAKKWHRILEKPHRKWLVLICLTALFGALITQAGVFVVDYMQTDRGLSPTSSNLILVSAGTLAIPVLLWAGSLSDRLGRKVVGCTFGVLATLGFYGFFWIPGGAPVMFAMLSVSLIGQFGAWPTLNAFGTELFPTSLRGQASSWATVARVTGQFLSFVIAGVLIAKLGNLPRAVLVMGLGPLTAFAIIAIFFPQTHGRELEDISVAEVSLSAGYAGGDRRDADDEDGGEGDESAAREGEG